MKPSGTVCLVMTLGCVGRSGYEAVETGDTVDPQPAACVDCTQPSLCGFADPLGNGSLVVEGDATFVLGPGPYELSSICVRDQARLVVCDTTSLTLTSSANSVIKGAGIMGLTTNPTQIAIQIASPEIFMIVDARPVDIDLYADAPTVNFEMLGGTVSVDSPPTSSTTWRLVSSSTFPPCP